jgi:DNA-binding NarL/FixJ family response regulator
VLSAREAERPGRELSERQRTILALVAAGKQNKHIARELEISKKTVKAHLTAIFQALGVTDRTQAALWAHRHGLGQ